MAYYFIINPKAGKKFENLYDLTDSLCARHKVNYEIAFTEYKGHGRELSREAVVNGFSNIIAVGGDGTVREVAEPLIGKDVNLGIIPCGSGNGLARNLFIPMNIEEAIRGLFEWKTRKIDAGLANGKPFFCAAGLGLDAEVARLFNDRKGDRGILPYVFLAFKTFFNYRPYPISAYFENMKKEFSPLLFSVLNGREYGGGAKIAPEALLDDGLFNITVTFKTSFLKSLFMLPDLFNGKLLNHDDIVKTFTARSLEVRCPRDSVFHLDGEDFKSSDGKIKFTLLEKILKVKAP